MIIRSSCSSSSVTDTFGIGGVDMRLKIEQHEYVGKISNKNSIEVDDGDNAHQDISALINAARMAFESILTTHDEHTKNFPLLNGDNGFLHDGHNGSEK